MKHEIPPEDIQKLISSLNEIEDKIPVYEQITVSSKDLPVRESAIPVRQEGSGPDRSATDKKAAYLNITKHLKYVLDSKDNEGCVVCFKKSALISLEVRVEAAAM